MSIVRLRNLPGRPGVTLAQFVSSRTAAMKFARAGKTVTAARSCGAINIWRTRGGRLHAEFYRYRYSLDHATLVTLADLDRWLKKWWPQLELESE